MYLLYSVLLCALLVLGAPYFLYRAWRLGPRALRERLGFLPISLNPENEPSIWIHAVSVGEAVAAKTLLPFVREAFPGKRVLVSVTTPTGRRVADEQLSDADGVFFCPFDFAHMVRRALRRVRPELLIVIETEIWPHLLREAKRAGAGTLLANGRISDSSYPRYRRIAGCLRHFLRELDHLCMQNQPYAERIQSLGAEPERISITGSLKFDAPVARGAETARSLLPKERTVLIAGSTMDPEEDVLLDMLGRLRKIEPSLLLVLAPRHPRRFEEVVDLARQQGFAVVRRSLLQRSSQVDDASVLVLDTLGELAGLYEAADVVFVGGSIAPRGGHNIIEPAVHGKAVLFGPHMQNFPDIAAIFVQAKAALQVEDAAALELALGDLLRRPERRDEMGNEAKRTVDAHRGAALETMTQAKRLMGN